MTKKSPLTSIQKLPTIFLTRIHILQYPTAVSAMDHVSIQTTSALKNPLWTKLLLRNYVICLDRLCQRTKMKYNLSSPRISYPRILSLAQILICPLDISGYAGLSYPKNQNSGQNQYSRKLLAIESKYRYTTHHTRLVNIEDMNLTNSPVIV